MIKTKDIFIEIQEFQLKQQEIDLNNYIKNLQNENTKSNY